MVNGEHFVTEFQVAQKLSQCSPKRPSAMDVELQFPQRTVFGLWVKPYKTLAVMQAELRLPTIGTYHYSGTSLQRTHWDQLICPL